MENLDALRSALPEEAKDLKLNIQAVLRPGNLTEAQAWGCALSSAFFLKDIDLAAAVLDDATSAGVSPETVSDAKAAAAIMGMNTVYYRFKHMMLHEGGPDGSGKDTYESMPAQLRMNRMAKVATTKADFELFSLACAAVEGCAMCLREHEKAVLAGGLTEAAVHDAVRIAATINGFSIGILLG